MKLTEREKAYHDGYKQGRFDEYAERMGYDQAEKVKTKIDKQKNCPYCHPGSKVNGRECWYHTTLALGEVIDSCTYTELYFDPVNRFLEAIDEDELFIDINYCPMCGRPLEDDEE